MPRQYGTTYGGIMPFAYDLVVTDDGRMICEDCAAEVGIDTWNDESVSPVFADSDWDSYPTCDVCGFVSDIVTLIE